MMFVYQVYLFHGIFVLKGSGLFGDAGDEPEDFVCADIGGQGETNAGGAFGYRRRTYGQGIETVALQLVHDPYQAVPRLQDLLPYDLDLP